VILWLFYLWFSYERWVILHLYWWKLLYCLGITYSSILWNNRVVGITNLPRNISEYNLVISNHPLKFQLLLTFDIFWIKIKKYVVKFYIYCTFLLIRLSSIWNGVKVRCSFSILKYFISWTKQDRVRHSCRLPVCVKYVLPYKNVLRTKFT